MPFLFFVWLILSFFFVSSYVLCRWRGMTLEGIFPQLLLWGLATLLIGYFWLPLEGLTLGGRIIIDGGIWWLLPLMTSDIRCSLYGFLTFLPGRWAFSYWVSTVRPIIPLIFLLGPSTPIFRCDILSHFFRMLQSILHLLIFLPRPGMCVQVLVRCVPSVLPWAILDCLSHIHVLILILSHLVGWCLLDCLLIWCLSPVLLVGGSVLLLLRLIFPYLCIFVWGLLHSKELIYTLQVEKFCLEFCDNNIIDNNA